MVKKLYIFLLCILTLILTLNIVLGGMGGAGARDTEDIDDITTVEEAIESGIPLEEFDDLNFNSEEEYFHMIEHGLTGSPSEDTEITLADGRTAILKEGGVSIGSEKVNVRPDPPGIVLEDGTGISGEFDISDLIDGNIPAANELNFESSEGDSSSGQGIEGFSMDGPDYTIDYADYWETESHKIVEGHGIQKKGGNIYEEDLGSDLIKLLS